MLSLVRSSSSWSGAARRWSRTLATVYQQNAEPRAAPVFANRLALRDDIGNYTYGNLMWAAGELSRDISRSLNGKVDKRVMFLSCNDANYLIMLWAIWMSGQIAVPLSAHHPKNILLYYASDTNSSLIVTTEKYAELMQRVSRVSQTPLYVMDSKLRLDCAQNTVQDVPVPQASDKSALIIYTSGTTGSPKGVVLTHKNLKFQTSVLADAWKIKPDDVLLHTLPLHHIHGIVNALLCPLSVGAKVILLKKFNSNLVWSYLLGVPQLKVEGKVSLYMAVPTIYSKLIDEYQKTFERDERMAEHIRHILRTRVRLLVSGSAPLTASVHAKWEKLTGHRLLERYGMSEIGMCLSNELESDRRAGYVGVPLPGVAVKLVSTESDEDLVVCRNVDGRIVTEILSDRVNPAGELLVKSDGVFAEYWGRPDATRSEFTEDGWFKTGDVCQYKEAVKRFRILGRKSADIIKSGGYKLSALQIEQQLAEHPLVRDIAVVGVASAEWGERVAAVVELTEAGAKLELGELQKWAEDKLPKYSVPTVLKVVEAIPRNAMGKINKKELVQNMF